MLCLVHDTHSYNPWGRGSGSRSGQRRSCRWRSRDQSQHACLFLRQPALTTPPLPLASFPPSLFTPKSTPSSTPTHAHIPAQERATGAEATVCMPCLVNNRDILDASASQRPQDPPGPSDRSFKPISPADFMGGSRSGAARSGQGLPTHPRSRPRSAGPETKDTDPGRKTPGRSSMGTEVGAGFATAACVRVLRRRRRGC